jgi:hypothetical protein
MGEFMIILKVIENELKTYDYSVIKKDTNETIDNGKFDKFGKVVDFLYFLQIKYGINNVDLEQV